MASECRRECGLPKGSPWYPTTTTTIAATFPCNQTQQQHVCNQSQHCVAAPLTLYTPISCRNQGTNSKREGMETKNQRQRHCAAS
jgi:hypothetical protein